MKFAFCLFKYFPFGGLQRDFVRIAQACHRRGHSIDVFAQSWDGEIPFGFTVHLLKARGFGNHGKALAFAHGLAKRLKEADYDAVVGFNKMPGLDVYFAADPCFEAKARQKHGSFYRMGRRYRTYAAFEREVFGPESKAEILLISEVEKPNFIRCYDTADKRFHFLPPGISRDRMAPANASQLREQFRSELGFADGSRMLLMIGSGFKTKGLDRSIRALAALPETIRHHTHLLVVGQGKETSFVRLARQLGVEQQLRLYGGRDDVPQFLLAADLLLQPSYYENTGTAIVEAIAAGLPVLATANCGYANYVEQSRAGLLVPVPFVQQEMNDCLFYMLTSGESDGWRRNALDFAAQADLFSLPERAADIIESVAMRRQR